MEKQKNPAPDFKVKFALAALSGKNNQVSA